MGSYDRIRSNDNPPESDLNQSPLPDAGAAERAAVEAHDSSAQQAKLAEQYQPMADVDDTLTDDDIMSTTPPDTKSDFVTDTTTHREYVDYTQPDPAQSQVADEKQDGQPDDGTQEVEEAASPMVEPDGLESYGGEWLEIPMDDTLPTTANRTTTDRPVFYLDAIVSETADEADQPPRSSDTPPESSVDDGDDESDTDTEADDNPWANMTEAEQKQWLDDHRGFLQYVE